MAISFQNHLRLSLTSALLGILLILGACNSTPKPAKCGENRGAYLNAQEHPPLTTPADMATPDRRNALKIPASSGKPIDKTACLQRAPSYFGTAGRIAASPEEMVADWAQAWADRNSTAVLAMYADKFETDAPAGSTAWLAQRGAEVASGPLPNARVDKLKVTQLGGDQRLASFTQQFGNSSVRKELRLIRDAGVWKIAAERVISVETQPATK
ncbi:MAG: hypothetical protein AB7T07_07380 [Steroidobacteraceae bacterium]